MSLTLARLGAIASGFSSGLLPSSWVLMEPSSVSVTGTSASIIGGGEVTFSTISSIFVNGVFTADFPNYIMVLKASKASGQTGINIEFSASGVANADSSSYKSQKLAGGDSTLTGSSLDDDHANFSRIGTSETTTFTNIYGPHLNQHTSMISVCHSGNPTITAPFLTQFASTHIVAAQYDGVRIWSDPGMSGTVKFYGIGGTT